MGSLTRPGLWPPKGGELTPQVQLFQLLVFGFLFLDVIPDDGFVPTYGRDEISACPETLTDKAALPLAINSRKMNRALAFDVPDHLRISAESTAACEHDLASNGLLRRGSPAVRPVVEIPDRDVASVRHKVPSYGILG